jgi:hypothetical protein
MASYLVKTKGQLCLYKEVDLNEPTVHNEQETGNEKFRETSREYLKDKINEFETNRKNKNIYQRILHDINSF